MPRVVTKSVLGSGSCVLANTRPTEELFSSTRRPEPSTQNPKDFDICHE
jgi:hypothetical protein